ncbi:MAG: DUF1349 domain-containing protein [Chloroflexota bacterium]|nr:DUF1349 domain-containing protein [Chloroflexota bacterium]
MRSVTVLVLVAALVGACAAQGSPTPDPTASPDASTAAPTPTVEPTPEPTPAYLFRDEFSGTLAEGWEWRGEDPDLWSLTDDGFLRIQVQPTGFSAEDPHNLLLRPAPNGDFVIETFVRFEPARNFEVAGLVIYEDFRSAMQFGRAFAQCAQGCVGNGLYWDALVDGQYQSPNYASEPGQAGVIYLRLIRIGDSYTASYSADGSAWVEVGTRQLPISPNHIGIIAGQGPISGLAAEFDYFEVALP